MVDSVMRFFAQESWWHQSIITQYLAGTAYVSRNFTHFMNNHLAGSRRFLAFHYSIAALFIIFWWFSKALKARLLTELSGRKSINHNTIFINCSPKMLYHPQFFWTQIFPKKDPPQKILETNPQTRKKHWSMWFNSWPFDHRVGGHQKGHQTSQNSKDPSRRFQVVHCSNKRPLHEKWAFRVGRSRWRITS